MSCSFVVTDSRRFDNPIIYASPTFCRLTGYSEPEVINRNCRFLQHPEGKVNKGDERTDTSPEAVNLLRNAMISSKECQTSLINYRKGGAAFVNLITVIPVPGGVNNTPEEADEHVYYVGFQVDLTEQPNAILNKLRNGTYILDYTHPDHPTAGPSLKDWRTNSALMSGASKELRAMLTDPKFTTSVPLALGTTSLSPLSSSANGSTADRASSDPYDGNKLLHLILLQMTPGDFIHVVSLKGAFLYVAPNVKRILGYGPEDLVGKSINEFAHPADVVPLMRELKESSTAAHAAATAAALSATSLVNPQPFDNSNPGNASAKVVDLLFRIKAKTAGGVMEYVWLESRGRLHVEPGKGRKAIILSGRVRRMPTLHWGQVSRHIPTTIPSPAEIEEHAGPVEFTDFWGLLSRHGTFLFVASAIRYVLGWGAGEVIGRPIIDLVPSSSSSSSSSSSLSSGSSSSSNGEQQQQTVGQKQMLEQTLLSVQNNPRCETQAVECEMGKKDGGVVSVKVLFFRPEPSTPFTSESSSSSGSGLYASTGSISGHNNPSRPIVCHIRVTTPSSSGTFQHSVSSTNASASPAPSASAQTGPGSRRHPASEDVFEEINPTKDTSWQYELQQLKYTNQRLVEEVRELEEELGIEPKYGDLPPLTSSGESSMSLGRDFDGGGDGGTGERPMSSGGRGQGEGEPVLLHRYDTEMMALPSSNTSPDYNNLGMGVPSMGMGMGMGSNQLGGWTTPSPAPMAPTMEISRSAPRGSPHVHSHSHMPVSLSMTMSGSGTRGMSHGQMGQVPYISQQHQHQQHQRQQQQVQAQSHIRSYAQLPPQHHPHSQVHPHHQQQQHHQPHPHSQQQQYSHPHSHGQYQNQDHERRRAQTYSYSLPLKRPWDATGGDE